jgi:hypothetical protein
MKTLLLTSLVVLSSCASNKQYQVSEKIVLKPSAEGKRHYVLWGLGQDTVIETKSICKKGEKVIAVDSYESIMDRAFAI